MSKSTSITLNRNIDKKELITLFASFFTKELQPNELLLSFNNKWIWFFFEPNNISDCEIQFSSEFSRSEKKNL
ncbi:hypothetical protein [Flavobacterium quisquiliarum]|uniref:Uncharacterized protein n=1 Tax=Flavobacterium quisquiliarum TaxID=1834436 RepID=A0ABV8WBT4_9FLAO|nr:hypothetical protein [Flavobacterium quisquiliarum]MBW1655362.1 hypothetical protein [Flavobacterium quisquiliarum]NWL00748.1 hypothetical protein [Flavobacterium collinsii]